MFRNRLGSEIRPHGLCDLAYSMRYTARSYPSTYHKNTHTARFGTWVPQSAIRYQVCFIHIYPTETPLEQLLPAKRASISEARLRFSGK